MINYNITIIIVKSNCIHYSQNLEKKDCQHLLPLLANLKLQHWLDPDENGQPDRSNTPGSEEPKLQTLLSVRSSKTTH